ncbi:YdcF family protein [Clostridium sp. NSJ-49]|uniref:YdcF family protein n=1 Tax=Clostridium TaxID=1485 RepID=UPI00164BDDE1|nr:YdcF family protein [Clostridium sp. NSJ-49]MBC5624037.1 YdcF family protein [Clostridium sp. NSJ-49]
MRIFKSRKSKLISIVALLLIVLIIIAANLGKFLVVNDDLSSVDAIVVFSGDNGPRTVKGIELLEQGLGDYLILSGGKVYDDVTMAELMKNHAIKLGVSSENIILDKEANSTYENALFTKEIIEENNFKSIILVTSEFHSRRSKAAMEKALEDTFIYGEKVKVMITSSKEEKFNTKWWTSGNSVLILIGEYLRLIGYYVKGYV